MHLTSRALGCRLSLLTREKTGSLFGRTLLQLAGGHKYVNKPLRLLNTKPKANVGLPIHETIFGQACQITCILLNIKLPG